MRRLIGFGILAIGLLGLAVYRSPWGQAWYWERVMRHGHSHDHGEAVEQLIRLHNRSPAVFARLLRDNNPGTRHSAIDALGELKPPNLIDELTVALHDYDSEVRLRAVELMGASPDLRYLPLLRPLLRDSDELMREEAIRAIGSLRTRDAIPDLLFALGDTDWYAVANAAGALRKITGQDFGFRLRDPESKRRKAVEAIREYAKREKIRPSRPEEGGWQTRRVAAPDLEVVNLHVSSQTGANPKLSAMRGKVVIVNFWAVWCTTCIPELSDFARLEKSFADQVRVIALSVDEGVHPYSKVGTPLDKFLKETRRLPSIVGIADEPVKEECGDVHEVPVTVVIDKKGNIYRRYVGSRSYEVFERDVRKLVSE